MTARLGSRAAALALGVALSVGVSSANAQTVDGPSLFWKVSTWGNPRAFTAGLEHMAERVKEATGGKWQMRVFYGEQLSKAKENLDGLKANAFEIATFCNFYHPGKNPALMVTTMPFLPVSSYDDMARVRAGLYENDILKDEMAQWNALYYASTNLPQYNALGRGPAPKDPTDFKGMRVRAGGGIGDAMAKLGAVEQTMPATETYTALQRGTVDAVFLPYTYAHASYKLDEVADWFTANLSPGTSDCPIVINKNAYDALPQQYKDLLAEIQPELLEVYRKAYDEADAKFLPRFQERLEEITYTDEQLAAFREAAGEPVWHEWVEANKDQFDAQAVLDLTLELAGQKGS
ncbi:C4-dicarboxylate ABC transporter substrate-binding protein [Acuticoccus sediminis]|uniref:C4-dicarboxylate ABC transporter substrate-binding protein n=1 Tax=Acuticoccus sediminis TaxID=2184697 RepID=A0A8B2NRQ4_9HYPH|nr:TRAP transporter substrate-binding protein DctP [Acuticoccus sediminis]RAH99783.1 C4-dicarboxylate ABC transporter substrate-binding protein [Acuticoccus sediminis]